MLNGLAFSVSYVYGSQPYSSPGILESQRQGSISMCKMCKFWGPYCTLHADSGTQRFFHTGYRAVRYSIVTACTVGYCPAPRVDVFTRQIRHRDVPDRTLSHSVSQLLSCVAGSAGVVVKLEFHGTDTDTDFRDAPIV